MKADLQIKITRALVKAGDTEGAQKTFADAKTTAKTIPDPYYQALALIKIATAQKEFEKIQ